MSAVSLSRLPEDMLRLVHGYLCPPRDKHCVVHDDGVALRLACKEYHDIMKSDTPACNCCVSLQEGCHFKYEEVCERLSYTDRVYPSKMLPNPSNVCLVHDCCADHVDDKKRRESVRALKSLTKQILLGKEALSFYFENWSSVDMFQRMLSSAKVKLAPKFRPVVTRAVRGLRVSWIRSRLPKYYPLVAFYKPEHQEQKHNADESTTNVDTTEET